MSFVLCVFCTSGKVVEMHFENWIQFSFLTDWQNYRFRIFWNDIEWTSSFPCCPYKQTIKVLCFWVQKLPDFLKISPWYFIFFKPRFSRIQFLSHAVIIIILVSHTRIFKFLNFKTKNRKQVLYKFHYKHRTLELYVKALISQSFNSRI
mgnify:CR=1 FL=1